jgi:hypothetical protein
MLEGDELPRCHLGPVFIVGEGRGRNHRDLVVRRRECAEVDRNILIDEMRLGEWRMSQDVAELVGAMRDQVFAVRKQIVEAAVRRDLACKLA